MGRSQVILLDTHAALWLTTDSKQLGRRSRRIADRALGQNELAVSAITFWEIAMLVAKERLRSTDTPGETRRLILDAGIGELPLTGEIALLAAELGGLRGDPADRFIAAAAIAHDATLMTADERLLEWRHALRRQNAAQ
jgi:PIN domain nuclease of toxin-antitoxin system